MARDGPENKSATPRVSVVVLAYESGATLSGCLASLRAQTVTDLEIILADNASSDGAAQAAALADPGLVLIENDANLGFAAGINRAAARARGRWLALLNPDAFAAPDWLERLLAAAAARPDVRAFASRQLMADAPGRLDGLGDVMSAPGFPYRGGYGRKDPGPVAAGEVFSPCGGAMLIDRALFLAHGGFDERLFCYCEDVDLGYRLRLAGERVAVVPDAVVAHVGSASSGGPRSDFALFHGTRNRLWVFVKDTPPLLFWATLPLHLAATALLFARHAARGELSAPWRGFAAGVRGLPQVWAARREVQKARKAGSGAIAAALAWNPLDLALRRVVIRKPTGVRPPSRSAGT